MAENDGSNSLTHGAGATGHFGARTGRVSEGARGAAAPQARVVLPTGPTAPSGISPAPVARPVNNAPKE